MSIPLCRISYPLQNPGTQTAHILSLPMVELAEKLKEGSLSPESVLYSYMGKVSEMYSVQGSSAEAAEGVFKLKTSPFSGRSSKAGDHSLSMLRWMKSGLWVNE